MLIGRNLASTNMIPSKIPVSISESIYQSEYTTTIVYNPSGRLNYILSANHINYFAKQKITCFIQPVVITFNESRVSTWTMKADKAKLTQKKILYLYGHVQVDNLKDTSYLKRIITDNAVVNLVTQNFSSNNKVTLYGPGFNSTGMKIHIDMQNKIAELIEKVETSYEIHHI
ncbi:Lipopolysaccharide export system protein LptC [Candidatus Gullanella endobia]|uniref:Lipopolysaccharide export system protein LptC n=2 Tax=Candidatus Gullanella endobia TaxID=1070130 RepID=A0A143WRL7_9ENTR|nr:Lipopolysaccharide export system protein LptC [Candidatus Gullanella endobia]